MACCADCEHCGTKVITPALPTHRPGRCGGFRSGRLAVQADAVVCVLVGLALVVLGFVHTVMPAVLQVVLGVLIAGWGIGLWLAPRRWPLRAVLTVVIAVNLLVVIALFIVGGLATPDTTLRPLAFAAAMVVAAFGLWEQVALRKTQGAGGSA